MNRVKRSMLACMPLIPLTIALLTAEVAYAASLNCGTWNVVTSPSPGARYNQLLGVAAVSASNVWAVGYADSTGCAVQTLTEQWNGTRRRNSMLEQVTSERILGIGLLASLIASLIAGIGACIIMRIVALTAHMPLSFTIEGDRRCIIVW